MRAGSTTAICGSRSRKIKPGASLPDFGRLAPGVHRPQSGFSSLNPKTATTTECPSWNRRIAPQRHRNAPIRDSDGPAISALLAFAERQRLANIRVDGARDCNHRPDQNIAPSTVLTRGRVFVRGGANGAETFSSHLPRTLSKRSGFSRNLSQGLR